MSSNSLKKPSGEWHERHTYHFQGPISTSSPEKEEEERKARGPPQVRHTHGLYYPPTLTSFSSHPLERKLPERRESAQEAKSREEPQEETRGISLPPSWTQRQVLKRTLMS